MSKHKIVETERIPTEDITMKLVEENADESKQEIEEAAYYIGLNRERNSHVGDHLNDWYEAERAVKEDLD